MIIRNCCITVLIMVASACGRRMITSSAAKLSDDKLQVFSSFERGAIGEVTYAGNDSIVVDAKHWKKLDNIGDQYYWFYFALSPVRNKNITVVLNKLTGIYRGGLHEVYNDFTHPVFSYNKTGWQRIPQVKYDKEKKSFSFNHRFEQDTVWLAYAHPYQLNRIQELGRNIQENKDVEIKSLGESMEGRQLKLFSISDHSLPASGKKVAVFVALQHPGEDCGGYVAEGIIRFLMADTENAREIKKKWIVHVVPVMNPDGLYHGITRYNANREDLNSTWLKSADSLRSAPEIKVFRNWLDNQFQSANPPDVFFDIHSHSQQIPFNDMFSDDSRFERIAKEAGKSGFPLRFSIRKSSSPGASTSYLVQKYNIPAALIELTQSYVNEKNYLTVEEYDKYGGILIQALNASF